MQTKLNLSITNGQPYLSPAFGIIAGDLGQYCQLNVWYVYVYMDIVTMCELVSDKCRLYRS